MRLRDYIDHLRTWRPSHAWLEARRRTGRAWPGPFERHQRHQRGRHKFRRVRRRLAAQEVRNA